MEVWNFTDDDIVDKSIVDREVPMDEPVTHAHDAPPRNFWMAENYIIRQALDGFSDDLEAPSEGALLDLIGEKVFKR